MRYIFTLLMISTMALLVSCQSTNATKSSVKDEVEPQVSATAKDTHNHNNGEVERISLEDAKMAFDAGDAVFIDTRSDSSFKNERVKGAINIPAGDFEKRYAEVPKDKKLIVYCSWPAENTSARVVQMFIDKGYDNAYALLGGTAAWKDAKYPMESGDK